MDAQQGVLVEIPALTSGFGIWVALLLLQLLLLLLFLLLLLLLLH